MASDYTKMTVLRVLHKAVHCVYAASPWNGENTMRTVCVVAHHQACAPGQACSQLLHLLFQNVQWEGNC